MPLPPALARPYHPDFDARVVEMGSRGFSWAEMAVGLGVNLGEFEAMMAAHPSFAEAVRRADLACWEWWGAWLGEIVRNPDMDRHCWAAWNAGVRVRFGARALRTMEWPPPPVRTRGRGRMRYDYGRIG
jgi:hypothetical protein